MEKCDQPSLLRRAWATCQSGTRGLVHSLPGAMPLVANGALMAMGAGTDAVIYTNMGLASLTLAGAATDIMQGSRNMVGTLPFALTASGAAVCMGLTESAVATGLTAAFTHIAFSIGPADLVCWLDKRFSPKSYPGPVLANAQWGLNIALAGAAGFCAMSHAVGAPGL